MLQHLNKKSVPSIRDHIREKKGSYLDDLKIEEADEFDIHIKIKLPFPVTLTEDSNLPGILLIKTDNYDTTPNLTAQKGYNFYISRIKLQDWFRKIFISIFQDGNIHIGLKSGRTYSIVYTKLRGFAVAYTFKATNVQDPKREIWIDFVAAFEYGKSDWISDKEYPDPSFERFAVPLLMYSPEDVKDLTFNICAPHQERKLFKDKQNLKDSLRILKSIKGSNGMWKSKVTFLKRCACGNWNFWNKPVGDLLIHIMESLIRYLQKRNLPFYWNSKTNLLDHIDENERHQYEQKLYVILNKVKNYTGSEYELRQMCGC